MNKLKGILTILFVFLSFTLYAQKEITIEEISRTLNYPEENKACFEILSNEDNLQPRSSLDNFERTQLADGTYSYKAILDLESATKRKFFIAAPLAIEKEYEVRGLKPGEYIVIKAIIPKHGLSVTAKSNVKLSQSSDAIYQFLSNIPDMELTTSTGQKFESKGKNESAFYVYELTVPVANTPNLTVTIKALGYDELTYNIEEVSQRVFGFFIFPSEACFNKNYELAKEYFRDGLYTEAVNYYDVADNCEDKGSNISLAAEKKKAENCKVLREKINEYDRGANRLREAYAVQNEIDSVYWYKSTAIDMMRVLLKINPADKFCSQSEIQIRVTELENGSRILVGKTVDAEFQNQVISNIVIYGSENTKEDNVKKMTKLGQTGADGNFAISVPNKFRVLYFEDPREVFKEIKVNITDGKRYSHRVQLRRKGDKASVF